MFLGIHNHDFSQRMPRSTPGPRRSTLPIVPSDISWLHHMASRSCGEMQGFCQKQSATGNVAMGQNPGTPGEPQNSW